VANKDLERIRESFKPERINVLFVGESPPRAGFFYDIGSEKSLSHFTRQAFEEVYQVKYRNKQDFLQDFKDKGCYLVDLFTERSKKFNKATREEKQQATVELSTFVQKHKPKAIIAVLKRIGKLVSVVAEEAQVPCYVLPFPSYGRQSEYKEKLKNTLRSISRHSLA
jgi:hypothetical protein